MPPTLEELKAAEVKLQQARGEIEAISTMKINISREIDSVKPEIERLKKEKAGLLEEIESIKAEKEKKKAERGDDLNKESARLSAWAASLEKMQSVIDEKSSDLNEALAEARNLIFKYQDLVNEANKKLAEASRKEKATEEKDASIDALFDLAKEESAKSSNLRKEADSYFSKAKEEFKKAEEAKKEYERGIENNSIIAADYQKKFDLLNEQKREADKRDVELSSLAISCDEKLALIKEADQRYDSQMRTLDEKEKTGKLIELKVRDLIKKNKLEADIKELGG